MDKDKIIGFIYETTDYSRFKRIIGNRAVDHHEAIVSSIKKSGYTLSPICVNEKAEIIDGQNREVALEELGMPVHYYIAEGATIDNCIAMNIGQKTWKLDDYVNSYAERGVEEFELLKEAKDKHPTLGYVDIVLVVNGGGDQSIGKYIKSGNITFRKPTYRNEVTLEFLEDVKPYVEKSAFVTSQTMRTLALLDVRGLIDKSRMLKQFKDYSLCERFAAVPSREPIYPIQELYNYNRRNCVYFADEYKKITRESNQANKYK